MKCKCSHEDYTHLLGEGKCQATIIKWESQFYEVDCEVPGCRAYTQDIEYGDDCACEHFTTKAKMKSNKFDNLDLDIFLQ